MKALLLAAGLAATAFATVAWTGLAYPHDALPTAQQPLGWKYPWSCCSSQDCRRADGEVKETANGYRIASTGEIVPYGDKRIKDSPDGEFHWCAHQAGVDKGRTICLFVPPRGF
jgi:hypothetical protein